MLNDASDGGTGRMSCTYRIVVILVITALLYGVSYQQFRHFDLADPRGLEDAISYVRMSHGDYNVPATVRYRFVIPTLAAAVRPGLAAVVNDPHIQDTLAFYVVNFFFMAATAFVFHSLLLTFGFHPAYALLGVAMFLGSRITVLSTGTPIIDSFYYLSIVSIMLSMQRGRQGLLACLYPLLILSKETIAPFMLLPLLTPSKHRLQLVLGLAVALGVALVSRWYIAQLAASELQQSLLNVILWHLTMVGRNTAYLFSLRGLYDLQNGYSVILLLAMIGFALEYSGHRVPRVFLLIIPLSLFFALLSNNLGRMFFASCFVVIPYALICLEHVLPAPPIMGRKERRTDVRDTKGVKEDIC